ncbi:MAG TPA: VOC family protein [Candidatus Angelobacter sp.]|nr:VOC family protein [Candidatus Angelobacter sp.]
MADTVQLSRINAIMLGVRDVPTALSFYKEKLGLKVIMQESSLALLQCGAIMLGLSRGLAGQNPNVAGATEVVFGVDNVRGTHKALSALGVIFVSEPHQVTPTDWVAHFKDLDGHLLSIFGPEGQA